MPSSGKIQVAVIGGGVCGLTFAIALQRAGVPVQLFEAASAFGEIGAGIGVGHNALQVLKQLGLFDEIVKKVHPSEINNWQFAFYDGLGDSREPIYVNNNLPEDRGLGIHRASFLEALVTVLEPGIAHFNKRCVAVTDSLNSPGRVVVHFQDGSTHEADVVIGADGVKSTVRDYVVGGGDRRIAFSNTVAYRGLIPYDKLKAAGFGLDLVSHPTCICGPSKHFILFPLRNAEIVNVVAFSARYDIPFESEEVQEKSAWVQEVTREVVEKEYEGWGPDATAIVKCMPEKPNKWSIHVVYPALESFSKGRVALIGDAAHAMLPHMGAGAGQGIEDAYVLSRLLAHSDTNSKNVEAVFQAYSRIRQPRAQMVWERSRWAGSVYDYTSPAGRSPEAISQDMRDKYHSIWHHDLEADIEEAIQSLRTAGHYTSSTSTT